MFDVETENNLEKTTERYLVHAALPLCPQVRSSWRSREMEPIDLLYAKEAIVLRRLTSFFD